MTSQSSAGPSGRGVKLAIALLWIGGAAAVLQVLLPWQLDTTDRLSAPDTTYAGTRYLRSEAVAFLGVFLLAYLFRSYRRPRSRQTSIRLLVLGITTLVIAGVGAYAFVSDMEALRTATASIGATLLDTEGPGPYMAVAGGLLATVGALLDLQFGQAAPIPAASPESYRPRWGQPKR